MGRPIKDLTGQRFGKLVVLERAEDIVSSKTGRKQAAWKCQCDCGNVINVRGASLNSGSSRSCGCSRKKAKEENKLKKENDIKHLSPKEKEDWDALYKYVKKVMGYDNTQNLPSNMVQRLMGLRTGKFIENKKIEDKADYSFYEILYAFQYSYFDIQKAFAKRFDDEWDKFKYITKIVENNLNTARTRIRNTKRAKEKTESADMSAVMYDGASYQRKTDDVVSDRLKDLW